MTWIVYLLAALACVGLAFFGGFLAGAAVDWWRERRERQLVFVGATWLGLAEGSVADVLYPGSGDRTVYLVIVRRDEARHGYWCRRVEYGRLRRARVRARHLCWKLRSL